MPKLRTLGGAVVIGIFQQFGFEMVSQKGSHIKLRRITADGSKQILTIHNHKELDPGTLRAIYHQSLRFIPEEQLKPQFYS